MQKDCLTDEEYGRVLDNVVIGCVDVAVIHRNHILLEKRAERPIQGEWWIFGGRMLIGETFEDTARRSVLRELELDIKDISRFKEIGIYNLRWPNRREPLSENGCHHLLVAYSLGIDNQEKKDLDKIISERTQQTQWVDMKKYSLKLLPEIERMIHSLRA